MRPGGRILAGMEQKRIAVLGAGNMGTALLRGILASGWGSRARLIASHPKPAKAAALRRSSASASWPRTARPRARRTS